MSKKITDLQPQKKNMNKHTEHGERLLRKTVQQYGIADGITVAANDEAISGSLRIETLADMMPDVKIQIVETYGDTLLVNKRMDIPTPDTKTGRALSVASNQVANTDYNPDGELLAEWGNEDKDIKAMFAESEWEEITGEEKPVRDAEPQIDRAAELLEKWQCKTGQLWFLGRSRLLCGDCTDPSVVEKAMQGERAKYLFTDPPYGIDYDPQFLAEIAERHNKRLSRNAKVANDNGELDLSFLFEYENRMIWGFPYVYDKDATGWIVWDKQPGVESRGIVTPIEMASTTMRKGFDMVRVMWGGFYRAAGEDKQPHPTQKPLGVYSPFVDRWTKEGELIFDPFAGSSPVLMVCESLKRRCVAIELDPAYIAVSLQRFCDLTGQTPVLSDL